MPRIYCHVKYPFSMNMQNERSSLQHEYHSGSQLSEPWQIDQAYEGFSEDMRGIPSAPIEDSVIQDLEVLSC